VSARYDTTRLPPAEVLDFFEDRDLKPAFSWADVWKEEHAVAFTVAGVMEEDLLADMHGAVDECLREGLPFEVFRKKITPILADRGWLGRKTVVDPITAEEKEVDLGDPRRLAVIFDTNLRTARAAGQWARVTRVAKAMPYLEYRLGPSRVHRPEHEAFDGLILPVDHPFWKTHFPPNGFGCFLPDTELRGAFIGASKAWYTGQAVEIKTQSGRRLSVTINHPVATPQGLVCAQDLTKGCYCLSHRREVEFVARSSAPEQATRAVYDQYAPILAQNIFDAFVAQRRRSVNVANYSSLDFHGEADNFIGEIQIVGSYVELVRQQQIRTLCDLFFALKYAALRVVAAGGHCARLFPWSVSKPGCRVSSFGLLCALLRGHFGHSYSRGFGSSASSGSGFSEPSFNNFAINVPNTSQGQGGFSGRVAPDQVIEVRRFDFSGHVYDFETPSGLILANNILTGNCKCGVRQLSKREADSKGGPMQVPDMPPVGWRNPRTGEELQVPYGVDPGFDYNPGIERFGGLK